jgi:hypothetical protein
LSFFAQRKVTKKIQTLSTGRRLKRYLFKVPLSVTCRRTVCTLLFTWSTAAAAPRLHAAEKPLPPDFVDYLGSVESQAIKGYQLLSIEEIYQVLKQTMQEKPSAQQKRGDSNGKEGKHGDDSKK